MNEEEFIEKYKDVELKFSSYYKYMFYFCGEKDGVNISAGYGGNHDDIYRYNVSANSVVKLGELSEWMSICATKDNETIFDYSDY